MFRRKSWKEAGGVQADSEAQWQVLIMFGVGRDRGAAKYLSILMTGCRTRIWHLFPHPNILIFCALSLPLCSHFMPHFKDLHKIQKFLWCNSDLLILTCFVSFVWVSWTMKIIFSGENFLFLFFVIINSFFYTSSIEIG